MSYFEVFMCPNCGECYSGFRVSWKFPPGNKCLKCNETLEWKILNSEEYPELYKRIKQEDDEYHAMCYGLPKGETYKPKKEPTNVPKCPTCQSTNVSKISDLRKVANIAMFGIFGQTRKCQFECKDCGYKW